MTDNRDSSSIFARKFSRRSTLKGLGATAAGPTITHIELETEAVVPGLAEPTFREHAEAAKKGCLVSRALAGVANITLKATLVEDVA